MEFREGLSEYPLVCFLTPSLLGSYSVFSDVERIEGWIITTFKDKLAENF